MVSALERRNKGESLKNPVELSLGKINIKMWRNCKLTR